MVPVIVPALGGVQVLDELPHVDPHHLPVIAAAGAVGEHGVAGVGLGDEGHLLGVLQVLLLAVEGGGGRPGADVAQAHGAVLDGHAHGVLAGSGLRREVDPQLGVVAGVVHARLLTADVHGVFLAAEALAGPLHPVGQGVPEALPVDHPAHQGQDGFGVAPGQLQALGLFPGEDAVFVALDGPGHGVAGGDGVHPRPVQQLVDLQHRIQVPVQQQGPEGLQGLILRLVGLVEGGVAAVADVQPAAAAQRAGVAVVLGALDAVDLLRVVEEVHEPGVLGRAGPVFDGPVAAGDGQGGVGLGAPLAEHQGRHGAVQGQIGQVAHHPPAGAEKDPQAVGQAHFQELSPQLSGQGLHRLRVGAGHGPGAAEHHGLELLAAHHRAHTAAGGDAAPLVADPGDQGQLLPRLADDGHAGLFPAHRVQVRVEGVLRVGGVHAPVARSVPQLHGLPVAEEIHRLFRHAGEEDGVVAALLDGRGEEAAAAGVPPAPGQGAFAGHGPAAGEEGAGAAEGPGSQGQDVLRPQGVRAGGYVFVKVPGLQALAAQNGLIDRGRDLLRLPAARAQVHPQDLAHERVHAGSYSPYSQPMPVASTSSISTKPFSVRL